MDHSFDDYQAVILAGGRGHQLKDLLDSSSKFTLPVANKPMIMYPLECALAAGFSQIAVVISEKDSRKLKELLRLFFPSWERLGIKVCPVKADDDLGSLEVLLENSREICGPSPRNLFVLSCDSITDVNLQALASVHRLHGCPMACLFGKTGVKWSNLVNVGTKAKSKKKFHDVIGLDTFSNRVCVYQTEDSFQEKVQLNFNSSLGCVQLHTQLVDPHVYVISRELLEFISNNEKLRENITRIKSELISYVVKRSSFNDERELIAITDTVEDDTSVKTVSINIVSRS